MIALGKIVVSPELDRVDPGYLMDCLASHRRGDSRVSVFGAIVIATEARATYLVLADPVP